jgi:hypothetical protein
MTSRREPTALAILTDLLADEGVHDPHEVAILVIERLADAGMLTDQQIRDCGLYRIVPA